MRRIIILLALSALSCSPVSAQGGGGGSARKGSSGKAMVRTPNSKSGYVRAAKLSTNQKAQLAAQMVKNAFNPGWFRKCMDEAGGIDKIVDIEAISLSTPNVRQYL